MNTIGMVATQINQSLVKWNYFVDYVRDFDGNLLDHEPYGVNQSDFADTVHVLEKQNLLIDGDCLRFDRNCSNLGRGMIILSLYKICF